MASSVCSLTLVELVGLLKARKISLAEAYNAYAQRRLDYTHLNAFTQHAPDFSPLDQEKRIAQASSGELAGAPLAVKDNIDVAGFRTTAGTPALSEFAPKSDAPIIAKLRAAGATFLGKTNMHELSFGATSINAFTGPVRNPVDPTLISGGSSGGSAAAVAAGLAPAALGTDTGGSCRVPAALCGVCGYRPSNGRYANAGVVPLSLTRDTIGILAKTIDDIEFLDGLLVAPPLPAKPPALSGMRFGVPTDAALAECAREVADNFEFVMRALSQEGVSFFRVNFDEIRKLNQQVTRPLIAYEVARDLTRYLASHDARVSARDVFEQAATRDVRERLLSTIEAGQVDSATYYQVMTAILPALRAAYAEAFDAASLDAILQPTTLVAAHPIAAGETVEIDGRQLPAFAAYTRLTDAPSNAGLACVTIPSRRRPAPLGVELQCRTGDDRRLFAIGKAVERSLNSRLPA